MCDSLPPLHQVPSDQRLNAWLNLGFRPGSQIASAKAPVLAQPDCRDAMGARQAKGSFGVNAEELRSFDGCQEWLPDTLDLNVVRTFCLLHIVTVSFE